MLDQVEAFQFHDNMVAASQSRASDKSLTVEDQPTLDIGSSEHVPSIGGEEEVDPDFPSLPSPAGVGSKDWPFCPVDPALVTRADLCKTSPWASHTCCSVCPRRPTKRLLLFASLNVVVGTHQDSRSLSLLNTRAKKM